MSRFRRMLTAMGLAVVMILVGACAGNVARRPGPGNGPGTAPNNRTGAATDDVNQEVASIASSINGAGRAEAVVMGNVALVALNVDGATQDATDTPMAPTAPVTPTVPPAGTTDRTGMTASPSPAPAGDGLGTTGTTPGGPPVARPGGGAAPGPVLPGGSPNATTGGPDNMAPPGFGGPAPETNVGQNDVQGRVATAIAERLPFIHEIRYTVTAAQTELLADIASETRAGRPITERLPELAALAGQMQPNTTGVRPGPMGAPPTGTVPGPTGTAPGAMGRP